MTFIFTIGQKKRKKYKQIWKILVMFSWKLHRILIACAVESVIVLFHRVISKKKWLENDFVAKLCNQNQRTININIGITKKYHYYLIISYEQWNTRIIISKNPRFERLEDIFSRRASPICCIPSPWLISVPSSNLAKILQQLSVFEPKTSHWCSFLSL